jgi:RimJ/RimL family protein N-acetyltransferase
MHAQFITNPWPVWIPIRDKLCDDNGELSTDGPMIGAFDGERLAGAFLIKRWTEFTYELHGGVHPDYWGKGVEIFDLIGRALFAGTPCLKILAIIPEFNLLTRRCVLKCGMKEEGRIRKAFVKHFRLHDLIVFGICKSEIPPKKGT